MNNCEVVGVYPLGGNLWTVSMKPINPIEALIGGRTYRIRASSDTEARAKAISRCKRIRGR